MNIAKQPELKNLVQQASLADTHVELDLEQRMAVKRDCRSRFWSQVVIPVMIAEEEFLKVWDICEERKMIRFKTGVWLKETQSSFDKFHEWINKGDEKMRYLLADYGVQVSKRMQRQVRSLYVTFRIYFENKGLDDLDLKAEVQTAMSFINLAFTLFDGFFDLYKERFGIDLREDYMPARIIGAENNFSMFADYILKPDKYDLHPCKNYASIQAYDEFCERLLSEKLLDEAGIKALELNHEDEFLSKIEREKMGYHKLTEKYKVEEAKPAKT